MSYIVMFAIGEYLSDCAELEPLPLIDLSPEPYRNWRGGLLPLFDETDRIASKASNIKPEPDRDITFKCEHRWSQYQPRMKDDHPASEAMNTTSKSIHWLF